MWTKPGHNPESPAPPVESGVRLALIERNRGDDQLRISLDEFNGHPFIRFAVWARGRDGGHWPSKGRTVSVKVRELAAVIAALQQAQRLVEQGGTARDGAGRSDGRSVEGNTATAPRRPGGPATALDDDGPVYVEKRRRPEPRPPWEEERKTLPGAPTMAAEEFNEFEQQG